MTRNDIIRMAREAGFGPIPVDVWSECFERFAALVAAAEREAIWNILFEYAGQDDLTDDDQSLLKHLSDLIKARCDAGK